MNVVNETSSIVLKCRLNEHVVNSLLDTGAGKSLMDIGIAEQLEVMNDIKPCEVSLFDASGNKMDIRGQVICDVELVNSG